MTFTDSDFKPEQPPPDPVALEIDLARLLRQVPHVAEDVDEILGKTSATGHMSVLHDAVRTTSSLRELRDALVKGGVPLQEAKQLADAVDDRSLCDKPESALTIARTVARRRAEAAVAAAAVLVSRGEKFTVLESALADLEAVKERLDDGTSQFPFEARIIPSGKDTEPRRWLYGHCYLRETVSALVAPGGTGKSIIAVVEALSIATGRHLIHDKAYRPRRVLYWNLEEGLGEAKPRFAAAAQQFDVPPEAYEGRLFFESGMEHPLKVATADRNGFALNRASLGKVKRTLLARKIDVLILDPVVSAHGVPENDNTAMDAVIKALARLAVETKVAVLLVHHARKSTGGGGGRSRVLDADDVRGAAAFVDACRIVRLAQRMTKEEAVLMTIEELARWQYIRLVDGKLNYSPPNEHTKWLQLVSVDLHNGDADNPDGDSVGVPVIWKPPHLTAGLPEDVIEKVQATARGARYQYHYQAAAWFGRAIAALVGVDPDEKTGRARLRRLTDLWITDGVLVLVERKTGQRKLTNFVGAPGDTGDPGASGVVIPFPNTYQPTPEEGGDE